MSVMHDPVPAHSQGESAPKILAGFECQISSASREAQRGLFVHL